MCDYNNEQRKASPRNSFSMESEVTSPCNSAFVGILSCSAASGHCTTPHPSLKPPRGFVGQGSWGLSLEGWGLAALWFLG